MEKPVSGAPELLTECPCCGQALPYMDDLRVSLDTNTATRAGLAVKLVASEAEILYALMAEKTMFLQTERLRVKVWGIRSSEIADSTIDVYLWRLRRSLAPLGLEIYHVKGPRGARAGGYGLRGKQKVDGDG